MRLLNLRVEQLRQFRNPIALNDLQPGINLIHGPNESGKSTLVRSIRAAFFERYRSKSVEDLRPWGDSAAAPTIELTFQHAGQQWQLTKSFLQRKRCDLVVDGSSYNGDEAEEKLSELLGYQFPKKGASKDEHWGIPGLLWIEQGSGQEIEKAVGYAGEHLKSALNNMVGEVASSGGDEIIQAVEKQRAELLTATGKPRAEYQQVEKDLDALATEIEGLEERIAQYQSQVDRLGIVSADYEKDEKERPWDDALRKMAQAQEQYRQVETLQQQQTQDQGNLNYVSQNLKLLRQTQEQMRNQDKKLQQREADWQKAQQRLEQESARTSAIDRALEEARTAYEEAEKTVSLSRQRETRVGLQREISKLERQRDTLQRNLHRAHEILKQLDDARKQRQENLIDAKAVQAARKVNGQLDEERIRSQTIATRLTWNLDPGKSLQLNGADIAGRGEQRLMEEGTLKVPGVGTLGVTPGGEDLASARRKLSRLEKTLGDQLASLGVNAVDDAERRLAKYQEAESKLTHQGDLLKSVAPNGMEQLKAETEDVLKELEKRQSELEANPVPPEGISDNLPSLADAESARKRKETSLTEAEAAHSKHDKALLSATQNRDNANREWQQLKEELDSAERQHQLQELATEIASAEKRQSSLEKSIKKREGQIQQARPDLLKQDIERYQRTAESQKRGQENRERELRDIRVRLEALGAEGLEEQRNERAGQLENLNRRYTELHRRAQALDLLLGLLTEKRQALTRRLQAPLQKHLDHYLSALLPDATLEVDETLVPNRFTRGKELGQMSELSFGAREQMGLISRLAYADLLQEADRPTLIILDDTLVHSDANRLDGMKRIIFDAAKRHQILLFTCHPENWRDLGVEATDLEELKARTVNA